jgi:hypothetical protein
MTEQWGQPPQGYPQQQYPQQAPQAWGPSQGQPQQQYPPQQGAWGPPPPQQAPAEPAAPPPTAEELWGQNTGGNGPWAASFKFDQVGSGLLGIITHWRAVPKTTTGDNPQQRHDKNGKPLWQHLVILQTDLRNWQGVARIPTDRETKQPLPPQADDGKRAIYLWYTLRDAVQEAVVAAGQPILQVGWELGVKVTGTKPNPQGRNAIKEYQAIYRPPSGAVQTPVDLDHPGTEPDRVVVPQQAFAGQPVAPQQDAFTQQPQYQQGPPPQQYAPQAPPQQYQQPPVPQGPPAGPGQPPQQGYQPGPPQAPAGLQAPPQPQATPAQYGGEPPF